MGRTVVRVADGPDGFEEALGGVGGRGQAGDEGEAAAALGRASVRTAEGVRGRPHDSAQELSQAVGAHALVLDGRRVGGDLGAPQAQAARRLSAERRARPWPARLTASGPVASGSATGSRGARGRASRTPLRARRQLRVSASIASTTTPPRNSHRTTTASPPSPSSTSLTRQSTPPCKSALAPLARPRHPPPTHPQHIDLALARVAIPTRRAPAMVPATQNSARVAVRRVQHAPKPAGGSAGTY